MSYNMDRRTTFASRMSALFPSPSPQPMLHFEFLFESTLDPPESLYRFIPLLSYGGFATDESLQHGGVPEAVRQALDFLRQFFPLPWHRASADVHVAAGEPFRYDAIGEAVVQAAEFLVIDGEHRDLAEFVCEEVRRSLPGGALPENAVLSICFSARTVYRLEMPVEIDDGPGMVPAADSSFRLLKEYEVRADVEGEEGRCCSICLVELGGGGGAVSLPCDHVFHGGSIKKWPRKSHCCPLCRYEMPTE